MNSKRKKRIAKYALALLTLLVPNSLSAQGRDGSALSAVTLEEEMSKGEKAPFSGVLVPWPTYYYYQEQVELNFDYDSKEQAWVNAIDNKPWYKALIFALGTGFGWWIAEHERK